MEVELSRQEIAIGITVFAFSAAAGMLTSIYMSSGGESLYSQNFNTTVDGDRDVGTVNFDNHSIDVMFEDSEKARVYLDYDRDGSFDRELNLSTSNETQILTRYVTLDRKSYEFRFQYRDNPQMTGEAYFRLIRIERIQ